jgi:hypothetical protein
MRATRLFVVLIIVQFLHSLEEVLTHLNDRLPIVTGYIHEKLSFIPAMHMSSELFITLNAIIVVFLIVVSRYLFKRKMWALKVARIVGYVEIVNGLIHISAALYTGGYWSGSISAIGLLIIGILLTISLTKARWNIEGQR